MAHAVLQQTSHPDRRDVCVELMPETVDPTTRIRWGNFTRWSLFG
jgi:hypothetical protein